MCCFNVQTESKLVWNWFQMGSKGVQKKSDLTCPKWDCKLPITSFAMLCHPDCGWLASHAQEFNWWVFQFCQYEGGDPLIPMYPCSGCGPGHSEEKCPEDDGALSEAGGAASSSHEDPQNSVWRQINTPTFTRLEAMLIIHHVSMFLSRECADIMTGGSRRCIVVSTLAEASFYADHGFDDILYAYPLPFDKVHSTHTSKRLKLK